VFALRHAARPPVLISRSPNPPIRQAQRPAATQEIANSFLRFLRLFAATVLFYLLERFKECSGFSDGVRLRMDVECGGSTRRSNCRIIPEPPSAESLNKSALENRPQTPKE
jgi:hypothetical protein